MGRSGRFDRGVNFSLASKPGKISAVGVVFDLFQKLDGFRFQAWLAWIVGGHNHLNINGDHVFFALN